MPLVATRGSRCHYSCYMGVKMSLKLLQMVKMPATLTRGQDVITVATKGQDASYTYKGSKCH